MSIVRITFNDSANLEVKLKLNSSATSEELLSALPFESTAMVWGDEVYFDSPIKASLEAKFTKEVVSVAEVAYWPSGSAVCLFFGPTPISKKGEIRPASAVNSLGEIVEGIENLRAVNQGTKLVMEPDS